MKRASGRVELLLCGVLAVATATWAADAGAQVVRDTTSAQVDGLRQVAGILDYIAGDYRAAVGPDRAILSQDELEEQRSLVKDADALSADGGVPHDAPLRATLRELAAVLEQVGSPDQVAAICKRARELLVDQHGLTLAPSTQPDRGRAAALYLSAGCNSCHGDDGGANTETAVKLDPPPANFLDPERVATVSAHRAFFAITYGVSGTGMTGYRNLSEADRWSLAFFVLSMRHDANLAAKGQAAFSALGIEQAKSARALATLTDEELATTLAATGDQRDAVLAYLRYAAPFEQEATGNLAGLQRALDAGLRSYRSGDYAEARRRFVAAYLDELEPQEPVIRARSAQLVTEMEKTMLALREAAAQPGRDDVVSAHVATMKRLAIAAGDKQTTPTAALMGALTITLREGLEIALLVGALLGLVRRRGQHELVRYVHAGWLAAIPAGLLTWWLAGSLLGGLARELAEGIAAIAAALVLLGVTHWLLGQATAKRFMGFLGGQLNATLRGNQAKYGVMGLSFVAAYREAFELVLFFQALLLDAGDAQAHIWLGVAIGLVVLMAATLVLKVVGQRLQPRPFMLASSALLALLAVVLIGKGVRALQEAGVIAISTLGDFSVGVLGLHATTQGLLAQGLLVTLLLGSAWWSWRQDRTSGAPT